jgi:hypothetical protein
MRIPAVLEGRELIRQGAEISGLGRRWSMHGVQGPLPVDGGEGQCYRIETSGEEVLYVYRDPGERGMRRLFLLTVESRPLYGNAPPSGGASVLTFRGIRTG